MSGDRIKRTIASSAGQTMVDLMIALALLALAVASSATLANSSFRAGQEAGRRSQAVSLGQRDFEGFRALRDTIVNNPMPPQNLWDYVTTSPPTKGRANGANCKQVYLVRANTGSGWETKPSAAVDQPQPYSAGDEFDSGGNPDTQFGQDSSGFARLINFCRGQDYSTTTGYSTSDLIYNVEIRVFWQESGAGPTLATGPSGETYNRQVIMHTVLSSPQG